MLLQERRREAALLALTKGSSSHYSNTTRGASHRCRKCGKAIGSGEMRIGRPIKWRGWITSWVHHGCFWVEAADKPARLVSTFSHPSNLSYPALLVFYTYSSIL